MSFAIVRQSEMEMAAVKERKFRTMKKNLKLLAVALVVLAIEKMTVMMANFFNSTDTDAPGPVSEIRDDNCVC